MKANNILKRILVDFLLLCVFSFSISVNYLCIAQKVDGIKLVESKNEFLKLPEGVNQVWEIQTSDEEIDQIIPFNETKALLKTIHFKNFLINYKYSNLSMINLEDGSTDWIFSTLDLEQKTQSILTKTPVVLIYAFSEKSSGFYALNPFDGKLKWNYPIKGNSNYAISEDNRNLFLSFSEKDKLKIVNLSLENGTAVWNNITTFDSEKALDLPRLFTGRDLYMISGDTIIAFNLGNGKLIWKNSLADGILSYLNYDENLWIYNHHEIVSLNKDNGKIQSKFLIPDKYISVAAVYNNVLFISAYDSINRVYELRCNDIKNLKINWTFPIESSIKSAIYNNDNDIFFSTEKVFYRIDMSTGTLLTNIILTDTLKASTLAFDIIEKRDENVIIGRENNILFISEREPSKRINIFFGTNGGFTPSYLQNKIIELKLGCMPERSISYYNEMNLYSNLTFSSYSRQYQSWVFRSTASTLAYNSNASQIERLSALNRREQAVRNSYESGRAEAYSQMVSAYGQLGRAIGTGLAAISQAMNRAAFFHNIDYIEEKLKASISYQTNCINDKFYIRPYFENGWRLAVIDINKPGYASIPMIPDLVPLRFSCTGGSVVYNVLSSGNKQYLLIKGLRPTPQLATNVYKFKFANDGKLAEWTLPKPSLICYDITNLVTEKKFPELKYIETYARPIDKELIKAAFFDDYKKVEELLKKGANVNANDEYGHTALMHACQVVDKKKVKILLEAGANPYKVDPEDFNAFTYTTLEFPPFDNDLKDIWKLLEKAMKKI